MKSGCDKIRITCSTLLTLISSAATFKQKPSNLTICRRTCFIFDNTAHKTNPHRNSIFDHRCLPPHNQGEPSQYDQRITPHLCQPCSRLTQSPPFPIAKPPSRNACSQYRISHERELATRECVPKFGPQIQFASPDSRSGAGDPCKGCRQLVTV